MNKEIRNKIWKSKVLKWICGITQLASSFVNWAMRTSIPINKTTKFTQHRKRGHAKQVLFLLDYVVNLTTFIVQKRFPTCKNVLKKNK